MTGPTAAVTPSGYASSMYHHHMDPNPPVGIGSQVQVQALSSSMGGLHGPQGVGGEVQSSGMGAAVPISNVGSTGFGMAATGVLSKQSPEAMQINVFSQLEDRGPRSLHRLCRLTVSKLVINKAVQSGPLTSIYIAVQFQNSKKTYRSPEIHLQHHHPPTHPPPPSVAAPPILSSSSLSASASSSATAANAHHPQSSSSSACSGAAPMAPVTASNANPQVSLHSASSAVSNTSTAPATGGNSNSANSDPYIEICPNFQVEMVYSHNVKKERGTNGKNLLVILVQRRNRLKGTAILGYKNVAACTIDMALVLQRGSTVQLEYDLLTPSSSSKEKDRSTSTNSASGVHQTNSLTGQSFGGQPAIAHSVSNARENCEVLGKLHLSQLSSSPFEMSVKSSASSRRANDKIQRRRTVGGGDSPHGRNRGPTVNAHLSDEFDSEITSLSEGEEDFQPRSRGYSFLEMLEMGSGRRKKEPIAPQQRQQRSKNFKQKLIRVLKKMKQQQEYVDDDDDDDDILPEEFDELDEYDSNSDLDSNIDENSFDSYQIELYPKPDIKPFFNSRVQLADNQSTKGEIYDTDAMQNSDGNNRLNSDEDNQKSSRSVTGGNVVAMGACSSGSPEPNADSEDSTSEILKNQLSVVFPQNPNSQSPVPKCVIIGRDSDSLCSMLQLKGYKVFKTRPQTDIVLIMEKILAYLKNALYSSAPRSIPVLRILIVGGERYTSFTLQHFVNLFSKKSQDLPKQVQFLLFPGPKFAMLRACDRLNFFENFSEYTSRFEQNSNGGSGSELTSSLLENVINYIDMPKSTSVVPLPISEALLHFMVSEDNSTKQLFVPFLNYLRLGDMQSTSSQSVAASAGLEEDEDEKHPPSPPDPQQQLQHQTSTASTPGQMPSVLAPATSDLATNAPHVAGSAPKESSSANQIASLQQQGSNSPSISSATNHSAVASASEYQIDVWDTKNEQQTIKGHITYLHIQRVAVSSFNVQILTREKKRIGIKIKKSKDKQEKSQSVELEGVTRLLCSCKAPSTAATNVVIDGCEYAHVKFFQVTTQWPTHVKTFPIVAPGAGPLPT